MRSLRILAAGLVVGLSLSLPAFAHDYEAGSLTIRDPWTRATPPGAPVAGGYVEIINQGTSDDKLIAVRSDIAEMAELHEMTMQGEVMQMRPIEAIVVPAGGSVTLAPGGLHIMFMELAKTLVEGEEVPGVLVFEKAGEVPVNFFVEAVGAEQPSHSE